ncbi:MAG: hypothetical protein IT430_05950 [Phycisphaerales bacterium]|nr:hypothetical protein [Phycisphaerales bacterium]
MSSWDTEDDARFNFLAPVLAWLVPGLGHWVLGHRRRARLIFTGIAAMYFSGLLIGGLDIVDRRGDPLWYAGQFLAGPITPAIDLWRSRHFTPDSPSAKVNHAYPVPSFAHANEIPTLFTTVAGMLNLLAILDVLVLPRQRASDESGSNPRGGGRE